MHERGWRLTASRDQWKAVADDIPNPKISEAKTKLTLQCPFPRTHVLTSETAGHSLLPFEYRNFVEEHLTSVASKYCLLGETQR